MWAFAFGRGPCLPRSPRLLASFCFLIRAQQVQIRGKALDFPDGAHAGGDPYPSPPPGIPDWRGFQGVSSQGIPDWRGFQKNLVASPPSAVGFPPLTRFAYTLPPLPPIRILKHLCDFVPGCPRLARICQPLWPFASCTCFRVVKDPSNTPLFRSGTNPQLYHLFALLSREKHAALAFASFHPCHPNSVKGTAFFCRSVETVPPDWTHNSCAQGRRFSLIYRRATAFFGNVLRQR
jgi:hypothetical protein